MKNVFLSVIITLVAALFPFNADAQQWKDHWTDYHWTNGGEMLSSIRLNKTQVLLEGYGYMDAGYGYLFEIKSLGDTNYDMKGIPESAVKERPNDLDEIAKMMLDGENCNGDDGAVWKRRNVNGHDLIISYFDDNTINSIYVPTGREMGEVVSDDMQEIISGTYTSTQGKKFQFKTDGTCIFNGVPDTYCMSAEGEYGTPSLHIATKDKIWELVPTTDGMKIYEAYHRPDAEGPFRGKLYATLKASKSTPRWSFLSDRICTQYALGTLDGDVLRIMRNEIYARQGYRFSDKKLQAYFDSCKWYKPIPDNSKVNLNGIETLNVSLIKQEEKYKQ